MDIFKNLEALKDAAERKKLCEIYYIKSGDGKRKRYELEPYEIKNGYLFAVHNGQTKQFKLHNIELAAVHEGRDWDEIKYARKIIGEEEEEEEVINNNDKTNTDQSS